MRDLSALHLLLLLLLVLLLLVLLLVLLLMVLQALKQVKFHAKLWSEGFPVTSLREISIMLELQHPNVVNVKQVVVGNGQHHVFMVRKPQNACINSNVHAFACICMHACMHACAKHRQIYGHIHGCMQMRCILASACSTFCLSFYVFSSRCMSASFITINP